MQTCHIYVCMCMSLNGGNRVQSPKHAANTNYCATTKIRFRFLSDCILSQNQYSLFNLLIVYIIHIIFRVDDTPPVILQQCMGFVNIAFFILEQCRTLARSPLNYISIIMSYVVYVSALLHMLTRSRSLCPRKYNNA